VYQQYTQWLRAENLVAGARMRQQVGETQAPRRNHIAHSTHHIAHSTNHTAHSTNHIAHSTNHIAHSTNHIAHSTQHTTAATEAINGLSSESTFLTDVA